MQLKKTSNRAKQSAQAQQRRRGAAARGTNAGPSVAARAAAVEADDTHDDFAAS